MIDLSPYLQFEPDARRKTKFGFLSERAFALPLAAAALCTSAPLRLPLGHARVGHRPVMNFHDLVMTRRQRSDCRTGAANPCRAPLGPRVPGHVHKLRCSRCTRCRPPGRCAGTSPTIPTITKSVCFMDGPAAWAPAWAPARFQRPNLVLSYCLYEDWWECA